MSEFSIEALRRPVTAKISAWLTMFFFTFVFYFSPFGRAVAQEIDGAPEPIALAGTAEQKMSQGLLKAQDIANKKHSEISSRLSEEGGFLENVLDFLGLSQLDLDSVDGMQEISVFLAEQHIQVLANFDQTEAELKDKNLPETILQRHRDTVKKYRASYDEMQQKFQAILTAGSLHEQQEATGALNTLMKDQKFEKRHQQTDPNKLPFGVPDAKPREPTTNANEQTYLLEESELSVVTKLAETIIAALIPSAYAAPIDQPSTEDLSETADVKITDAIRLKADELNNDPVEIYNWVRNNVEYLPVHGAIQGSDMTLQTLRGNAFDASSLLIALLRAADTPARYAYGTVEIPVEKVMNWVGDVKTPEAAQQVLGQGGIPNTALVRGGVITHIRMEHIWVNAWIDYFPSRGAKNIQGDSWIPMDGSFKQYEYTSGSNLFDDVPFDIETLNEQILQTADVDEQLGAITGVDSSIISNFLNDYQQSVEVYFSENGIDPTVENILGAKNIIQEKFTTLAAGLPYDVTAILFSDSVLPANLQHSVQIKLYDSEYDKILNSPSMSHTILLSELNSRRLGMTYDFVSEADKELLQSYVDSGATSLPVYLFNVKPTLKLDDQTLMVGGAVSMGSEQFIDVVLKSPDTSDVVSYEVTAGDEMVFGINGNGITQKVVEDRLSAVPSNTAAENLHQVALHYWMEYDFFNQMTAAKSDIVVQRLPSVGLFFSPLTVSYFFGVARSGQYQSRIMDVKRSISAVAGGTAEQRRLYVEQSGLQGSFLEGSVFDQLYGRSEKSGISAVQLIVDSNLFGIPLHFVTSDNIVNVMPRLTVSSDIKRDISNAINAGKTVLVPERELTRGNWNGTGYIIRDVQTGAGAYLISGGLNGGGSVDCEPSVVPLVVAIVIAIALLFILAYFFPLIGVVAGIPSVARAMIAAVTLLFASSPALSASSNFEDCREQWISDTRRCDNSFTGRKNVACHRWAQEEYYRCIDGCPAEPFTL
ncbi:MAG: hypothetical protein COA42_22800 [Alteromonadaceae bacterium]|nr:transglutaminase domain-containing protein [Colwellia sp.]PCK01716.1 MAG: hypothetical protein COA42_22800 [Alteromonadaceae bacterium]